MAAARKLFVAGAKVLTDLAAAPAVKDILIEDGIIAAIGSEQEGPPPDAKRLDARGKLAIPGLVNAHYHSHDVLARGMFEDLALEGWIALAIPPPARVLTRREARLRTLLGAIDCLRNGITTVQDMLGCGPGSEEQVEAVIDAYNEVGIRCVLGLQVGNRAAIDGLPGIRERLPAALAPMLSAGVSDARRILDFVAEPLRRSGGRLTFAIAPGSPQRCTFDLLCGLAGLSARHRLPMVTHVSESKSQVMLKQAGVRLALGADNTSAGDAQNLFEAMKLVCNMSAGKGPARSTLLAADALAMATTAGAQAIRLAGRIGRIAVGMAADLTLLDLSDPSYLPLNDAVRQIVYCESGRGVHTVIVDGEIVVEDRRVRTVDYDALLAEVAALHDPFARDAGAHAAFVAPVLPYILDTVRAHAGLPLPFDRWPSADDRLPDDGGA